MSLILPFDTETTGLPDWKNPSDSESQPHLVEIGALLVDESTRETIETVDVIIRPDGWEWDEENEAFKKHGITFEKAMDEGIPEQEALEQFMALYDKCDKRTAFNTTFDNRMIRVAQMRYGTPVEIMEAWKSEKDKYFCTMIKSKEPMSIKKWPTLVAAHAHFFGEGVFKETHRALADAVAAKEIYFALKDMGVV